MINNLHHRHLIGGSLIILGASLLFANLFNSPWLIAAAVGTIAAAAIWFAVIKTSRVGFLLGLLWLITAYVFAIYWMFDGSGVNLLGLAFFGAGWLLFLGMLASFLTKSLHEPWLLIPAGICVGLGAAFLFTSLSFLDFVLAIGLSLGCAMILWSFLSRYYGLMIAGAVLASHATGVAISWQFIDQSSDALLRVGIMLLLFALGWALISLMSRFFKSQIAWWPLIPAGILSVTGWGLFIGGNPESSKMFLGNTGSFALMILGLYVLLLRSGLNKN